MSNYRQSNPNKREDFIKRMLSNKPIKSQSDLPEVTQLKKIIVSKPKVSDTHKRQEVKKVFNLFCLSNSVKIDFDEISKIWVLNKNLLKNISAKKSQIKAKLAS